jgi:hypothetical protein
MTRSAAMMASYVKRLPLVGDPKNTVFPVCDNTSSDKSFPTTRRNLLVTSSATFYGRSKFYRKAGKFLPYKLFTFGSPQLSNNESNFAKHLPLF